VLPLIRYWESLRRRIGLADLAANLVGHQTLDFSMQIWSDTGIGGATGTETVGGRGIEGEGR
jgi:hypothetical protein